MASWACRLVPTNRMRPPWATVSLTAWSARCIIGTDWVRSTMWMLLRVPKMYSCIFGFHRWAAWPKCTPASKSWRMLKSGSDIVSSPVDPPRTESPPRMGQTPDGCLGQGPRVRLRAYIGICPVEATRTFKGTARPSIGPCNGLGAGHRVGRHMIKPLDQSLDALTTDKIELQIDLGGFRDQIGVVHGCGDRVAQRRGHRPIETGRCQQRPPHGIARKNELKQLSVGGGRDEIGDQRNVRQLRMPVERDLQDDSQCAVVYLLLVAGPRHAPGIADDAVKLAALDGQHQFLSAGIAGNDLELGAEQGVERLGEYLLIAPGAGRANFQGRAIENILEAWCRPGLANEKATNLVVHAAEPGEFGGVEFRRPKRRVEDRLHGDTAPDNGDLRPVSRRRMRHVARQIKGARARPVLWDDQWIAGKVFAEIAGEQPAIGVIAITGGRIADQEPNLLADKTGFVLLRLAPRREREHDGQPQGDCAKPAPLVTPPHLRDSWDRDTPALRPHASRRRICGACRTD